MSNPEVETPALEVVEDSQLSHVFDPASLARSIEAILMVVDEPVTELTLASLLPEVLIGVGAVRFAAIAERVLTPKAPPLVALEHLHSALVSVAEESKLVVEALRKGRTLSFRNLIQGADSTLVVVARFLALLDLYRQGALRFEQVIALGELQVSWIGSDEGEVMATDEFDIPVLLEDSEPSAEISHENKTEEEENV